METKVHEQRKCGAKTRSGSPCKNPAGFRTDHLGEGRCYLHGGKSTGPKDREKQAESQRNNKNAVKTGEYESIIFDILEEEEKELYNKISLDRLNQINNEIRLTDIRLRRMMIRIKELQEYEYTVVSYKEGLEKGHPTELKESEGTLGQIQSIEDAITRVQAHKAKLIDLKHKLEQDLGINRELQETRIEKTKADINKITGNNAEVEDLSEIYQEIYGDINDDK